MATTDPRLLALRETPPATAEHLWQWVRAYTGVRVARAKVCRAHDAPFDWFSRLWLDPPPLALVLGARGAGKSFLSSLGTHVESRFRPGLGTRVLGGSKAQSAQVLEAIASAVLAGRGPGGSDRASVADLQKESCHYRNGSKVSILAASPTSVRGPHVPRLKLDEVDEILPELREAAMGMCMPTLACPGADAAALLTSTWHRVGGPMSGLVERGRSGDFPLWTTCTLDVLERCPESRSGPFVGGDDCYANCPACPIVRWCHRERDANGGIPLAKLSDGHYPVDALAQKAASVSARTFEADYLCSGPRPDGLWFAEFDPALHVSESAEFDPSLPVHVSVDSGVVTGAVFFQVRPDPKGNHAVNVFGDFLAEGRTAEQNARDLLALCGTLCNGRHERVSTDQAGGARNPVGPTVLEEYRRAGLRGRFNLDTWPAGPVADSLALLEGLLKSADGSVSLRLHPRCKATAAALANYRRAKRAGQWQDYPEDPQHPHEDLVDALRGGLKTEFPDGRKPNNPALKARPLAKVRY